MLAELLKSIGELNTGEVLVRGRAVPIVALSASTRARLEAMFPRPVAPLVKNPAAGSLAPLVPSTGDPAHVAACEAWFSDWATATACVGTKLAGDPVDEEKKQALRAAMKVMMDTLAPEEIGRIYDAMNDLIGPERATRRLVAEVSEEEAERIKDEGERFKLPGIYATLGTFQVLSVFERFGIDPWRACGVDRDDPGMSTLLLEYDRVRKQQEAAESEQ